MNFYKIYILDRKGRISLAYDFEGADDAAAIEESKKHSQNSSIEIWQGSRLVALVGQRGQSATG